MSSIAEGGDGALQNSVRPHILSSQALVRHLSNSYNKPQYPSNSLSDNNGHSSGRPSSFGSSNSVSGSNNRLHNPKQQCQRPHKMPRGGARSKDAYPFSQQDPAPVHIPCGPQCGPHLQSKLPSQDNGCHSNVNINNPPPHYGYPYDNNTTDGSRQYPPSGLSDTLSGVGKYPPGAHNLDTISDSGSTTSGSYVVDPEDLCNEINNLFFKDLVV